MQYYPEMETFLRELEDHMRAKGLSEGSIRTYLAKIKKILESGYSVGDLCGGVNQLIRKCSSDGEHPDHNARSALTHVKTFVAYKRLEKTGEYYIAYDTGWQSFRTRGKHTTGYRIAGDEITVYNSVWFTAEPPVVKKIPGDVLYDLLDILDSARWRGWLGKSNPQPPRSGNSLPRYDYSYKGQEGQDCRCLVEGKPIEAEALFSEYQKLIRRFTC